MNHSKLDNNAQNGAGRGSFKSYIVGFLLSLALTLTAYGLVARHINSQHQIFSDKFLIIAVASLAAAQLLAQLIFFLHLGRESKPRWNLLVFSFMAIVLIILVGGSLWIMYSLDYHKMNPEQTNTDIIRDEGIRR